MGRLGRVGPVSGIRAIGRLRQRQVFLVLAGEAFAECPLPRFVYGIFFVNAGQSQTAAALRALAEPTAEEAGNNDKQRDDDEKDCQRK